MPMLETPIELAEQIADWCGIYGTDDDPEKRQHFESEVAERIRESVKNETLLNDGNRSE